MKRPLRVMLLFSLITLSACGGGQLIDVDSDTSLVLRTTSATVRSTTSEQSTSTTIVLAPSKQDPPSTTASNEPPMTTVPPSSHSEALQRLVDLAVADLAGRLGVGPTTITVVSADGVVWPDAGLGCPEVGMAYIQVLVDGSLIILSAGGTEYHYHAGGKVTEPFLCGN